MSVASSRSSELSSNSRRKSGGFLPVHRAYAHGVEGERFAAGVQRGELAVEEHGFELPVELFLEGGLHALEAVADGLQRGIVVEQLFRGLLAHAADAGDVVAGVPDDGLHVGPLGGGESGFLLETPEGDDFLVAAGGVPHHDVGVEALLEVLVRGDEDHRAFLAVALGKRGEAVVGLAAFGYLKGCSPRALISRWMGSIWRMRSSGRAALGPIQREQFVPEVGTVPVEHEREMLRLLLPEDAHEDAGHDEQRAGREPVRTLHALVGVESRYTKADPSMR